MAASMKVWRQHPALAWFCGGALFMATLGAPLSGAGGALAWTMQASISDGWGDDTLAARKVVAGVDELWGLPRFYPFQMAYWNRPETGDTRYCETQLRRQRRKFDEDGGRAIGGLHRAMVHNEQALSKQMADREAEEAFIGLPRLALGALAQCMDHSLLAGGCTLWARHHLEADKQVHQKIDAVLLANAREADDQACFLLEAAKDFSSPSTKDGIGK